MLDFSISNFANVFAKSYLVHEQLNPRNVLRLFLQETIRAVGASGTNQLTLPRGYIRVIVQGVESLWGDCRFIPADWGS